MFPSIKLPVLVVPYTRKYYGTIVADGEGTEVAKFWTAEGSPSSRELDRCGGEFEPCDNHWECENDLRTAENLVALINATIPERSLPEN
jgi:hypothetical protein